jgi:hypothetical protein
LKINPAPHAYCAIFVSIYKICHFEGWLDETNL